MQATDHLPEHHHEHDHDHRREMAQAWLKTFILFALGAYFAVIIITGNLANYINQRFAWLSYVAVALFLVLGAASLWDLLRQRGRAACHCDDHEHEPMTWRVLAVVAVPLVLGTLIPSRPLGSAAVNGDISVNAAVNANFTAFNSDPLKWNVLDWLRAFNSAEEVNSFNGKPADVVGFVYHEPAFPDGSFMVARFTVSCCVADASAIGLPVLWAAAGDFPQDTWVRVQGTFEVGEFRGDTVPVLRAASVERVEQPEHPYLYP